MNIIKSYEKLSKELKLKLDEMYPDGVDGFTKVLQLGPDKYVVVPFNIGEEKYLIKLKKLAIDKEDIDISKLKFDEIGDDSAGAEE